MTRPTPSRSHRRRDSVHDTDIVTRPALTRRMALGAVVAALAAPPAAAQSRGISDRDMGPDSDPAWGGRGLTAPLTDTDPTRDPPGGGQVGKRVPRREPCSVKDIDDGAVADPPNHWRCQRPR